MPCLYLHSCNLDRKDPMTDVVGEKFYISLHMFDINLALRYLQKKKFIGDKSGLPGGQLTSPLLKISFWTTLSRTVAIQLLEV